LPPRPPPTGMTAARLDYVSDRRFLLGPGASGPQVDEGFHGVPYDAPLARSREIIDICRQVWRRERVEHDGTHYQIPLAPPRGSGLVRPI
ncbi:LLM class flavin-dependent oxidoreductase, partial [Streptomyces sp. GbtcB7]|uniref:LLM class flavin-dependent oxidoreductase n=1 Tax=Streptomyces sp. GbtcB7 TaxID=2824752 RepID=UPI001C30A842